MREIAWQCWLIDALQRRVSARHRISTVLRPCIAGTAASTMNHARNLLQGCALQFILLFCATPRLDNVVMMRCHLSSLMGRDKLNISDVARATGLNRSTITALYRETATRIELPAIEQLCVLFSCSVGDLLEVVPASTEKGAE